jgi:hypothetical protein
MTADTPEARCAYCGEALESTCPTGVGFRHETWTAHADAQIIGEEIYRSGGRWSHHAFVPTPKSERQ